MTGPHYLSDCHNAPAYAVGGVGDFSDKEAGMTMHYQCSSCHESCNFHPKPKEAPQDRTAALRESLKKLRLYENMYGSHLELDDGSIDQIMEQVEAYAATREVAARIEEIAISEALWLISKSNSDYAAESTQT